MGITQRGPALSKLAMSEDERDQLQRWVSRRKSAHDPALRSRIVLECATGVSNSEVSRRVQVSLPTVRKWRSRFLERRLDGLVDEPRPGRPALISVDRVRQVVVDTLESTPPNATHWSRAKISEKSGLSRSTIGRIWKAFGLAPHLAEGFKLSNDSLFTENVYDIVGVYLNPPESAVVLSVDEKS
jgi:transposase